jgi:hypothetical protein
MSMAATKSWGCDPICSSNLTHAVIHGRFIEQRGPLVGPVVVAIL